MPPYTKRNETMKERTKTPQQICEQTNRIFGLIDMQSREGKDRAILRARNHKVSLCCQRYIANIYEYIKGDERKTLSIEETNNLWHKANVPATIYTRRNEKI